MTKSVKAVVIASAALLVLGGVLLVLLLTGNKPDEQPVSSSVNSTDVTYIVQKKADEVTSIRVENGEGVFTFKRQKRVVSSTDSNGTVTSKDEYYWTTDDLKGVAQNDLTVRNFIAGLATLLENSRVEDAPDDFEKYGLAEPQSTAFLEFEDGTDIKMLFGIQNPADSKSIYFKTADSDGVSLVNYYAASVTLSDVRQFAELTVTEALDTEGSNVLRFLKITRPDLAEPIEIRYMSDMDELASNDDIMVSTFNTHRFTAPVTAEVDLTKGQDVCYKMYGLTMSSCEFLEQSAENLAKCGFDEPRAVVEFRYGGKDYKLTIGGEIREEISGEAASVSGLTGYYAMMDGVPGIYALSKDNAPWVNCDVSGLISRRPLSPYIYSTATVDVTAPEGKYTFEIDTENKKFFHNGDALNSENFRTFYQFLISPVGEELYSGEVSGTPMASVTFSYIERYYDIYAAESDTIEYYADDGRKCIVVLNGEPIFRVSAIYVERLSENIDALLNGGTVGVTW